MDGNRGAKGSIKDRLISMLYRMRYKKKKLKEQNYTVDKKEQQLNYINNLQDFKEDENINILDAKDKIALDDVKYTTNFKVTRKKGIDVKRGARQEVPIISVQEINQQSVITPEQNIDTIENNLNIKLDSIESKTGELSESVNLKKEIKKTKDEIIILKEVDKFVKTSIENLDEINTELNEIKEDIKGKNKPAEEIEKRYNELKKKITKLKDQYSAIKEKYDLSEFSILESIKLMDSIDNYKSMASLNEVEMMVKVCIKEIEKIDSVTIVVEEGKKVENNIEEKRDIENKIKVKFNKNKTKVNELRTIEEEIAYELKVQQDIVDEMYKSASYLQKEVSKKMEYIGHKKIISSLFRIAGGILTIPLTGSQIFGVALGSTMINKGLKEMNKKLETKEKIVINYKYEDISRQILEVKDKIGYTNIVLIDSLSEIKRLKTNFNEVYKDYKYILPDYVEMIEKIAELERRLVEQQSKLVNMDKKLEKEKEINKQKLKKVEKIN